MDLVITDIEMPGLSGLKLIRERWRQCHVMILTAFPNFDYAYAALQMHTDGYILKTESDSSIRNRVLEVLSGIRSELHYPCRNP